MAGFSGYSITYESDGQGGFIPIFKMRGERFERVSHRDGSPVRCKSPMEAENAAAKHLLARLNRAEQPQEHYVSRRTVIHHPQRESQPREPVQRAPARSEADRVFANFKTEPKK